MNCIKPKHMKPKPSSRVLRFNWQKIIASALLLCMAFTFVGAITAGFYPPAVTGITSDVQIVSAEPEIIVEDNTITPAIVEEIKEEVVVENYITKYSTTGLNIRKGPSTDTDIVKTVSINTELSVLEGSESNDWVIVKFNDEKYYVNSKYLSNEKTVIKSTTRSAATSTRQVDATPAAAGDFVGYFTLTYYCSCAKCCGKTNGITAWGTKATAGRTIATSSAYAFGTKLVINGHTYVVEDRGGAIQGNKIDVYVDSHSEALKLGVKKNVPVYMGQ